MRLLHEKIVVELIEDKSDFKKEGILFIPNPDKESERYKLENKKSEKVKVVIMSEQAKKKADFKEGDIVLKRQQDGVRVKVEDSGKDTFLLFVDEVIGVFEEGSYDRIGIDAGDTTNN